MLLPLLSSFFFFFNDTATTEIYTLSLHDALPILRRPARLQVGPARAVPQRSRQGLHAGDGESRPAQVDQRQQDRKSTRLNSSHLVISYAVFCLKKKKKPEISTSVVQLA